MKAVHAIKYFLMALVAGVLMWLAFRGVNFSLIINEIEDTNMFWLGLSLVMATVAFVSRAYRWKLLIDPLGHQTSLWKAIYSLMVGYLANLAFPRLGEITRCGTLSKANKIPFDQLLGTVILERVLDVLCLLTVVAIASVVEAERLSDFIFSKIIIPIREKASGIYLSPAFWMIFTAAFVIVVLFIRNKKKSEKHSALFLRINVLITGIGKGLRSFKTINKPWQFLFHTVLIWILYYYMAYVCFFALPSTSMLGWQAAMFVLVAGGIGMSVPVQGGIGAYHLLVSQGLALYGIEQQHALAFATLVHTSQTVLVILLGGLSLVLLFTSKNKSPHEEPGIYPIKNS